MDTNTIPPTGLTELVSPAESLLDIVFVHGFTGHPQRTWTHKNAKSLPQGNDGSGDEPPLKSRKLHLFSKPHQQSWRNDPTAVYWPRDLLPSTTPNARVLTYGYDTHIRHKLGLPLNKSTVYDISWNFLVGLEAARRAEPSRPVLFVVHSLGGIVVKEMLRRSSGCRTGQGQAHLRTIFDCTKGLVFFGTPHGGADPLGTVQRIAEKAVRAAGFQANEQIVNTLLPSAERLRELRDEFGPIAQEQNWKIHSFQEQYGVQLLSGHKVVEDVSSYLNLPSIEICEHIGANHMDMCRFTGLDDVEYRKVASALRRIIDSICARELHSAPHPEECEQASLAPEQKVVLLDSLRFDQIDARQMSIKNAHAKTCKWLLQKSEYQDWLNINKLTEHHGFLWIKGKPGTGKSTLMKFALREARKTMKNKIIISFFFNARGEDLEKSTIGTYRSLLLQLLERLPALQSVFESLGLSTSIVSLQHQWSVESLKALLEQAVHSLGESPVVCFIDALDECEERQVRDMISFFEGLGELAREANVSFQICFSSRHYPHITIKKGLELILEGQEGHSQDISNYLGSELKIGRSKIAEQIRTELQDKASGVFMWVVLVIGILNKDFDRGRMHTLRRRLQEIPGDLHELFRDILTRDSDDREELLLCIQWVLFARQSLKPEQLYFAILSQASPEAISQWDPEDIPMDSIERYILNASKGLVETSKSKVSRVQFIHESVRDFLLKENGLSDIWPDLRSNLEGQSHDRLKQSCINYMNIDTSAYQAFSQQLPTASFEEAKDLRDSVSSAFPFLEYAVRNVLYHADAAEGSGIGQQDFMHGFQLAYWVKLDNLFEKHHIRRHTENVSLLYLLAEGNLSNLLRIHHSIHSFLEVESERYGRPLFAALATGSFQSVEVFLKAYAATRPPSSRLHSLCSQYCQGQVKRGNFGRDFKHSAHRTILSYLAGLGDRVLFAFFLEEKEHLLDDTDQNGRIPFWYAANHGNEDTLVLLLELGWYDVEFTNGRYATTPLIQASMRGHEGVVKLLLKTGKVDINAKSKEGHTALSLAVLGQHPAVVKLLLETNEIDVNIKTPYEKRPLLSLAVTTGNVTLVKLLVETGRIDVQAKDYKDHTPLWFAVDGGHAEIVKLLIETGRIDFSAERSVRTARLPMQAVYKGHVEVVKLLLQTDKLVINERGHGGMTLFSACLSEAARQGHVEIVKLLLATPNVDIKARDERGSTPLWQAVAQEHVEVVKLLLQTGKFDTNERGDEGVTLLSEAARGGYTEIVKLLVATHDIDVGAQDEWGCTPLWHAVSIRHVEIVNLLLETDKVGINIRNCYGETPILQAAKTAQASVAKLLIQAGVDVNLQDKEGRTPLWWARFNGHDNVSKLLREAGALESP